MPQWDKNMVTDEGRIVAFTVTLDNSVWERYKWEWDLPWPPRSAWSVTDTRRCTPVCTGLVPPTSQSHSSARQSHCHPVNNVHRETTHLY